MGAGIHVLVVDDNPQIRELLLESLRPLGNIVGCANASEASRRAAEQTPDLIVSDYRMPGLNGMELLAKLRHFRSLTWRECCWRRAPIWAAPWPVAARWWKN